MNEMKNYFENEIASAIGLQVGPLDRRVVIGQTGRDMKRVTEPKFLLNMNFQSLLISDENTKGLFKKNVLKNPET